VTPTTAVLPNAWKRACCSRPAISSPDRLKSPRTRRDHRPRPTNRTEQRKTAGPDWT